LKIIAPSLSNDELLTLYTKSISIHQGKIQRNGSFLENDILVKCWTRRLYKQQVTIDKCGIIVGFNESADAFIFWICNRRKYWNWKINNRIQSRKLQNNVQKRWTQDDWVICSNQFCILLTLSDDYPRPVDLEKTQTEIISCIKRDDRIYKLNFENLIEELL
jgi:hypothetical protein